MKTYFTEAALGITAAILIGSTAMAGPLDFLKHQKDGYRDTGCDPAQQVQITNDAGEYLYSNNPTCPDKGGAGFALPAAADDNGDGSEEPVDPVDPEEPTDPVDPPTDPVDPEPETPCKSCAPETA